MLNILILCPGKIPHATNDIHCFTEVLNYYLPISLEKFAKVTTIGIAGESELERLTSQFNALNPDGYDAILTLGLRFYSKIPKEIPEILRSKFSGILCQVHDGSRLDNDPVDITFTFKNDEERFLANPGWLRRHNGRNIYMGWAADPEINVPNQSLTELRILVDHTNYGNNPIDKTTEVLQEIKKLIDSNIWKSKYESVKVRRFDSGKIVDVDFNQIDNIERYDRSAISLSEISIEHGLSHIFMVTHPESVGLVVLETSMAGALTVTPDSFIPKDRLNTVRHVIWRDNVDWPDVLRKIDPSESRKIALSNTWDKVSERIVHELKKRLQLI